MKRFIISLFLIKSFCLFSYSQLRLSNIVERRIVIVIASYNNKQWYKRNLDSIFAQKYDNYRLIYVDDCSTDGTYELVKKYIEQSPKKDKFTHIKNDTRQWHLLNQFNAIHSCKDTDIIAILDGDDWFYNNLVLARVNQEYQDPNVWLTYGQLREYPQNGPGCKKIPQRIVTRNAFRKEAYWPYFPSHLRTFYAGLFKRIKKEDLMYKGTFFKMCCDLSIMFPMMEMAHKGHIRFIPDVLVIYNMANALNCYKISKTLQHEMNMIIRNMKPYNAIEYLFNPE